MRALELGAARRRPFHLLCLGAHADDIEIGAGGLILQLTRSRAVAVDWVVFSAAGVREREARRSARLFLKDARGSRVVVKQFRDGYFPYEGAGIKDVFEQLKSEVSPDLVLTHHGQDLHQDHRTVSEMTRNTFRDQLILEYEIPKYDGDLGSPNCFLPLDRGLSDRKIRYLVTSFASQRGKHWFSADAFKGLMRLRGLECRAPGGYAEGFYARKVVLDLERARP